MTPTQITECTDEEQLCEWISVDERTPDDDKDYLVLDTRGVEVVAHYWAMINRWLSCDPKCQHGVEVTHWMPLPKPPIAALNGEE